VVACFLPGALPFWGVFFFFFCGQRFFIKFTIHFFAGGGLAAACLAGG